MNMIGEKVGTLTLVVTVALMASARPRLYLPDEICAVPGVECNVYFKNVTDAIVPERYGWRVACAVGSHESTRWTLKAKPAEAGGAHPLVLEMWSDEAGLVAAATTMVRIVTGPAERSRKITLALLADSLTNCNYQDELRKLMRKAGFAGYTPVGSHGGSSASMERDPVKNALHDGYGGYSWGSFLTTYAMSVDEIDNLQSEAEREQLRKFAREIPKGQEWRKALLKSPLVRLVDGKKTVDVQAWFDKVNGGKAPDYILIELGTNDRFLVKEGKYAEHLEKSVLPNVRKLIDALRAAAPETVIGILTVQPGQHQDAFGKHYGCKQTEWEYRTSILTYDERLARFVRESGDPRLRLVPVGQAVDTVYGYIRSDELPNAHAKEKVRRAANAVHPDVAGGMQMADAVYAWLMGDLK